MSLGRFGSQRAQFVYFSWWLMLVMLMANHWWHSILATSSKLFFQSSLELSSSYSSGTLERTKKDLKQAVILMSWIKMIIFVSIWSISYQFCVMEMISSWNIKLRNLSLVGKLLFPFIYGSACLFRYTNIYLLIEEGYGLFYIYIYISEKNNITLLLKLLQLFPYICVYYTDQNIYKHSQR